jgi:hypothetical protein
MFKIEEKFFPMPKEYSSVLGAKKSFLGVDMDQGTSNPCF